MAAAAAAALAILGVPRAPEPLRGILLPLPHCFAERQQ